MGKVMIFLLPMFRKEKNIEAEVCLNKYEN